MADVHGGSALGLSLLLDGTENKYRRPAGTHPHHRQTPGSLRAVPEGRCHHQEAVVRQTLRENISWYLLNDPAWGVTDQNDTWWCPLTLTNVRSVIAKNGRFDNTAIEYMVAHLLPHYPFNAADLHDESQVIAARSRRESHPPADHEAVTSGPLEAASTPKESEKYQEPPSSTVAMMLLAAEEQTADISLIDLDLPGGVSAQDSTIGDDLGWMDDIGGTVPAAQEEEDENEKSDLWWMDDLDSDSNEQDASGTELNTDLIRASDVQKSLLGDLPDIPLAIRSPRDLYLRAKSAVIFMTLSPYLADASALPKATFRDMACKLV